MILTVKQIYDICGKIMKEENTNDVSKRIKKSKRFTSVFILLTMNMNEYLFEGDFGVGFRLHEEDGRIYCYTTNMWRMCNSKIIPITNDILSKHPLSKSGEEFVKKYL